MSGRRCSAWIATLALVVLGACACGGLRTGVQRASRRGERAAVAPPTTTLQSPGTMVPARRYGPPGHDRVPILMYHVVTAARAGATYPDLWTPGPVFAAQMRALRRAGYHAVTLGDAVAHWAHGLVLPRRPIVITFDDGYASQYRNAARTLRRVHWPGVLFLEVHNMSIAGGLPPRDVRRMLADGWELGSHTVTHPDLTTLDAAALRYELVRSREILQTTFHVAVRSFCYPIGRFDAAVEEATRAAGYRAATTEQPGIAGPGSDRFALPRIRVTGSTTPQTLLEELRPAV